MVGQTPPASSNGSSVRVFEMIFASVALFGAAFAVGRAAFERRLPYAPPGALPNPWTYRPPIKGYTLPGTPRPAGGWPTFEVKLQGGSRSRGRSGYELLEMEQWPGSPPTWTTGASFVNKNEALYQAGLRIQAYARDNPRNTNTLRVLDEKGHCVYAVRANEDEPGFIELRC